MRPDQEEKKGVAYGDSLDVVAGDGGSAGVGLVECMVSAGAWVAAGKGLVAFGGEREEGWTAILIIQCI